MLWRTATLKLLNSIFDIRGTIKQIRKGLKIMFRKINSRPLTYHLILLLTMGIVLQAESQDKVIDETVAIVGSNIILLSDIENQYTQYRMQGNILGTESGVKCEIIENLLMQNLLLHHAEVDSLEVTEGMVESELDRRLRYYIMQFGDRAKFEEFYKKTVEEFKEEFRPIIRDQLLQQRMEQEITGSVGITPSEVKRYFINIPKDSLPNIEAEYEIAQIIIKPPISELERERAIIKINNLRERLVDGENFEILATLYSDDAGSAENGGRLPTFTRGVMYPGFEAAAFSLKPDEISEVIETRVGYHIVQLIGRRGEYVDARHILIKPTVSSKTLLKSREKLDSIAGLIRKDSMDFATAADLFSQEEDKNKGGIMLNPMTQTTTFAADDIDPSVFFVVDKLEAGEMSKPALMQTPEGGKAYRMLYLKKRTEPHKPNLETDYDKIQNAALDEKKFKVMKDWIAEKIDETFIKLNEKYQTCNFEYAWLNK